MLHDMYSQRFNQLIEDANNFILQRLEESDTLSPVEKIICLPNASATEVFNNPDILYSLPKYNQYYAIIGIHKKEDCSVVLQTREIENYNNTDEYHLDGLDDFGLIVLANYIFEHKVY